MGSPPSAARKKPLYAQGIARGSEVTEFALPHRPLEIDVGCHHQSEVGLDRLGASDTLNFTLLNGAEQLRLKIQAEIRDLVQKEGAAGRELEFAELLSNGAREGTTLVAEQGALDQISRHGRQVDGNERRVVTTSFSVQETDQELLAGSAFPLNEHGGRQPGDLLREIDDLAHDQTRSEHEFSVTLLGNLGVQGDQGRIPDFPEQCVGKDGL